MSGVVVDWHGTEVAAATHERAVGALHEAGKFLLDAANETVPKETGALEASGQATVDEDNLRTAISYDEPYAVWQHEDTELRHEGEGRAKWLQLTMQERGEDALKVLAEGVRL